MREQKRHARLLCVWSAGERVGGNQRDCVSCGTERTCEKTAWPGFEYVLHLSGRAWTYGLRPGSVAVVRSTTGRGGLRRFGHRGSIDAAHVVSRQDVTQLGHSPSTAFTVGTVLEQHLCHRYYLLRTVRTRVPKESAEPAAAKGNEKVNDSWQGNPRMSVLAWPLSHYRRTALAGMTESDFTALAKAREAGSLHRTLDAGRALRP